MLEEQAYNATNEVVEERLENKAETVRETADEKADAIEEGEPPANTAGM